MTFTQDTLLEKMTNKTLTNWISMSIHLGDYINKTLDLITGVNIKTIWVYGFIVFAECLRAHVEVEYDYANTLDDLQPISVYQTINFIFAAY